MTVVIVVSVTTVIAVVIAVVVVAVVVVSLSNKVVVVGFTRETIVAGIIVVIICVIILTGFEVGIGPVTRRNGSLLLRDHQIVVARRRSMRGAAVTRPRQVSRGHVRALGRHVSGDRSAASHVAVLRSLAVR